MYLKGNYVSSFEISENNSTLELSPKKLALSMVIKSWVRLYLSQDKFFFLLFGCGEKIISEIKMGLYL